MLFVLSSLCKCTIFPRSTEDHNFAGELTELFSYGPGNIREFFQRNYRFILYTIIFHLLIVIVLVLAKVEGLKKEQELGVMLDFTEEVTLEDLMEEEKVELSPEWIDQVFEAREQASNRAVNVNDRINSEISTEEYVNELLDELESQKDEEFLENREKWKEIISTYVYEEEGNVASHMEEEEEQPFTGPTTITYEFLEPPVDRQKRRLFIPVYKCEGGALVKVEVGVRRDGTVSDVRVISVESSMDPDCFTEAAKNAAQISRFKSDYNAPPGQKARITYQFIAQ